MSSGYRSDAPDTPEGGDLEARFRILVQSPLRAGLLRFLSARPGETFDVDALMSATAHMRLDVENCLTALSDFGVARRIASGSQVLYAAQQPDQPGLRRLRDMFLERRAPVTTEDQSPSVRRFRETIGRDEKMLVVFESIRTAAKSDLPVMILGPTGSGTEVVARVIHELSRRGAGNFHAVNCAARADTPFEAEIFGYEKASLTGAHDRRPARLELADRGTLLLDEIGRLSLVAQAKLLRVLENPGLDRPGGQKVTQADFRLITASSRPLDQLVRDARFREDLYDRVNAFAIRLPSLRERPVDIPVLASRFAARYCAANGLPPDAKTFAPEAISRMLAYPWPGNLRELESTVSRAALTSPGRVIRETDVEFLYPQAESRIAATRRLPTLADAERAHVGSVLEAVGWNKKEAARVLDISRGTLYRKIFQYSLEPEARSTTHPGSAHDL